MLVELEYPVTFAGEADGSKVRHIRSFSAIDCAGKNDFSNCLGQGFFNL